jgi:hypothetical protein
MADIKVKDGFNKAETGDVVNTTELVDALLNDPTALEELATDATFLAKLQEYFDTLYEPIVV